MGRVHSVHPRRSPAIRIKKEPLPWATTSAETRSNVRLERKKRNKKSGSIVR